MQGLLVRLWRDAKVLLGWTMALARAVIGFCQQVAPAFLIPTTLLAGSSILWIQDRFTVRRLLKNDAVAGLRRPNVSGLPAGASPSGDPTHAAAVEPESAAQRQAKHELGVLVAARAFPVYRAQIELHEAILRLMAQQPVIRQLALDGFISHENAKIYGDAHAFLARLIKKNLSSVSFMLLMKKVRIAAA